jgi:hypothetical protein
MLLSICMLSTEKIVMDYAFVKGIIRIHCTTSTPLAQICISLQYV